MSAYPLMLDGSRLEALIVGGGVVAARKASALLEAGAAVRVVASEIGVELGALASTEGRLAVDERPYVDSDIGDALLIIAATDDRETNAAVSRDARARGRLVNVADAPEEGNCVTPAVHRSGELVVAVVAGGVPSAAARVRDAVGVKLDARYAEAVRVLAELRGRLLAAGARDGWRRASAELVSDDFCAAVESGAFAERVRSWR